MTIFLLVLLCISLVCNAWQAHQIRWLRVCLADASREALHWYDAVRSMTPKPWDRRPPFASAEVGQA